MRILAYIRGLPCSSNIFPEKSDPYLYGSIVAVRLRANLEAHSRTNERGDRREQIVALAARYAIPRQLTRILSETAVN
jgi:hypothetical protein